MDIYLGPAVFGGPEDTIIKLIFRHRAKKIPGNEQKKKKKVKYKNWRKKIAEPRNLRTK